jgi:RNA polymerase sigma-70 factor (ECF subfamily)
MGASPPLGNQRDEEARLEALFRSHYRDVATYVRRRAEADLVEDVVAETFLVAWRRLDEVPMDARPWLLGVARKTLATQRRSVARRRSLLTKLEAAQSSAEPSHQPGEELGVTEALMRLSGGDREALTLVAWEGLSPKEAALVVGQSAVAFRVRFHRAKRRLRERLALQAEARESPSGFSPREIPLPEGGPER